MSAWHYSPPYLSLSRSLLNHLIGPRQHRLRVGILVVEDHADTRIILRQTLQDLGARVSLAEDGRMALHVLDTMPQRSDVILCDLLMPGMDGLAFAAHLHRNPKCADIPVRSALDAIRLAEAELARPSLSRRKPVAPDALAAWLHSLREPVTAIAGWGQLLGASPAAVGRIRACEAIERNAKRLIQRLAERPAA